MAMSLINLNNCFILYLLEFVWFNEIKKLKEGKI